MTLTLAETYPQFLDDLAHKSQLRPSTIRAYQYELAAAAQDNRFQSPLESVLQKYSGAEPGACLGVG